MKIITRFPARCQGCGGWLHSGEVVWWEQDAKLVFHLDHAPKTPEQAKPYDLTKTITLSPGGTKFIIRFDYDHHMVVAVRGIPGAEFKEYADHKEWQVPVQSFAAIRINEFIRDFKLTVGAGVRELLTKQIIEARTNIATSKATDAELTLDNFGSETLQPYPYQRAGIAYGIANKRVIIADEPGLGKTIQGLGIAHVLNEYPLLISTLGVARENWSRHILGYDAIGRDPWLPLIQPEEVAILEGLTPVALPPGLKIIITSHDILAPRIAKESGDTRYAGWRDELIKYKFKTVIIDEIHKFKSAGAQRSAAAELICKDAKIVLGLTGTPFPNRPKEIMQPLKIIGRLEEFGGEWKFGMRYCGGHQETIGKRPDGRPKKRWNFDGASNLPELHDRLRATCYVRREARVVKTEMPGKARDPLPWEIDNRVEYDEAEWDTAKWLGRQAAEDKAFLQSIAEYPKARQVELRRERAYSAEMRARANERVQRFWILKRLAAKGKMNQGISWAEDMLENDEKLVVFAWHKDIQTELYERLQSKKNEYRVVRIHGDDNAATTQKAMDDFQQDPNTKIIVCSILKGSEAVDLFAAAHCLFIEYGWGPGTQNQAEGRLWRDGQQRPVHCHYSIGLNTVDEEIMKKIDDKRRVTTVATSGFEPERDETVNSLVTVILEKYKDRLKQEKLIVA